MMNQVLSIVIVSLASAVCLIGFFLSVQAFFGRILNRTNSVAVERASRSFLTGLINTLFVAAIVVAFLAVGQNSGVDVFFVLAFILAVIWLIASLFGLTTMVLVMKDRLYPGQLGNRALAMSAAIAILGCLTPYIGWFGLLPYMIFRGTGAFILVLVEIRRERSLAKQAEGEEA
jgi:hypothetical protein